MSDEYEFVKKADQIMEVIKQTLPKVSNPKSLVNLDEHLKSNPVDAKTLLTIMCDFADEIDTIKSLEMLKAKNSKYAYKKQQIIEAWKSGKYSSKDICAEQECAALGLSFATARKYLRNI